MTIIDLTNRPAESHIPFVVIGGMAGVLQGSSLMTRDALAPSKESIKKPGAMRYPENTIA
jgi:hypothetical protein